MLNYESGLFREGLCDVFHVSDKISALLNNWKNAALVLLYEEKAPT